MISVIIPTCHRNDLLAKCLDCLAPSVQILPQEQYEVIVTDDGSRSTAEQLVREAYPWAKWVTGPRRGPAANRNNGARLAQGEWLAFTDDDCLPDVGWLSAFHSAIEPSIYVYEGKTTCKAGLSSPFEHTPINLTGGYLWSCNMMVQREIFENMGGFDEDFPHPHMEDTDFRTRLQRSNLVFVFVSHAVVDHPPRKAMLGKQSAASLESEVMFWYKTGNKNSIVARLLLNMIRFRIIGTRRHKFSLKTIQAIAYLLVEVPFVLLHISGWEKTYRKKFAHGN